MEMTRLIIVEDSDTFVRGLEAVLAMEGDFEVVAVADNGDDGLRLARQHQPDLMLIDMRIKPRPGSPATAAYRHGVLLIERLRIHVPDTPVVAMTFSDDKRWMRQAARAGAVGYLSKDQLPSQIANALRMAAVGHVVWTRQQLEELKALDDLDAWLLSAREVEILRLLDAGLGPYEIAERLGIVDRTVHKHEERMRAKLGVKNRVALLAKARDLGYT
jgi:DNA-binding NarL/FixJ family response regulator